MKGTFALVHMELFFSRMLHWSDISTKGETFSLRWGRSLYGPYNKSCNASFVKVGRFAMILICLLFELP
jgi:hypothetical protein